MERNQTVSLGCGTLILIALIVTMCSNPGARLDGRVHQLEQEVRQLRSAVENQTRAIEELRETLARLEPPSAEPATNDTRSPGPPQ